MPDLGSSIVDVGASSVFGFLATGTSEAVTGCGQPLPLPLGDTSLGDRNRVRRALPLPLLVIGGRQRLLGWRSGRGIDELLRHRMGATAATSAMDARATSIAENRRPQREEIPRYVQREMRRRRFYTHAVGHLRFCELS